LRGDQQSHRRVIFVPFIDGFGGVERLVLALSRYMTECGIEHLVLCYRDSIGLAGYATWPLRVVQLNAKRHPLFEALSLRAWMARNLAADSKGAAPFLVFDLKGAFYAGICSNHFVLHLTDPPSLLAADISLAAPSLGGNLRLSKLIRPWQWHRMVRAEVVHRLNKKGTQKANSVIVMTTRIARELEALYDVRTVLIRPGVSPAPPRDHEVSARGLRFLSVSRLEESKRISWILRALKDLEALPTPLSHRIDWTLDIVGEGPSLQSLRTLVQELELSDRIVFHGWLPDATLETVYEQASIFLMPAVQGYGLPALEALCRRTPVILHSSSGVSEILGDTPWVEMFYSDQGADLACTIIAMIEKVERKALSPHSLPRIPLDVEWARQVCLECKWVAC
jgi:glycosyltransferase involved in cell wall biosynthesis